ncbi:MAG: hypothetical protein IJ308_03795 [Clostridia bacterium]|nr:hypothetical protein [Clostridia bacterium]
MTKKKLALGKAVFSLAIIIVYVGFLIFFFTYGQGAFQRAADKMGEQQTLGGIGAAVGLTFALIALIAFAIPGLLFIISCIGNFASKGNKVVGFTAVSLVAEILACAALFFLSLFAMDGTLYDAIMVAATGVFDLAVIASFVHSIVVLVKQKNAQE